MDINLKDVQDAVENKGPLGMFRSRELSHEAMNLGFSEIEDYFEYILNRTKNDKLPILILGIGEGLAFKQLYNAGISNLIGIDAITRESKNPLILQRLFSDTGLEANSIFTVISCRGLLNYAINKAQIVGDLVELQRITTSDAIVRVAVELDSSKYIENLDYRHYRRSIGMAEEDKENNIILIRHPDRNIPKVISMDIVDTMTYFNFELVERKVIYPSNLQKDYSFTNIAYEFRKVQ